MANDLEKSDWSFLLKRISRGECTPVLGPGSSFALKPSISDIVQQWAKEYDYPMKGIIDLPRLAQFLAVRDPIAPKELVQEWISSVIALDLTDPNAPYNVVAELPLPFYITTNHDGYLEQALQKRDKEPKRVLCRWNRTLLDNEQPILENGFTPNFRKPVIFYLYGHHSVPESLVLTEDDYLDFIVNISSEQYRLPTFVRGVLGGTSLLFIGYDLEALSFRVLFRGVVASTEQSLRRLSITVQMLPIPDDEPAATRLGIQQYLNEYFQRRDVRVYWGTAQAFAADLRQRWQEIRPPEPDLATPQPTPELAPRTILRQQIDTHFSLGELRIICFDLEVDYDSLAGETKDVKITELIIYLQRRNHLQQLIEKLRCSRPNVTW